MFLDNEDWHERKKKGNFKYVLEYVLENNYFYKDLRCKVVMSRDCWETSKTLVTPHVEIEFIKDYKLVGSAGVNVSAFEDALTSVLPASTREKGPMITKEPHYLIYGVVGRIVNNHGWAYLNISEPPISRTLMGYLTKENLEKTLPKTFTGLKNIID